MIKIIFLFFNMVLVATAFSQNDCDKLLIAYSEFKETEDIKWKLELKDKNDRKITRLYYFGASHSSDTNDVQFKQIKEAFDRVQPDVVFFEGPNRGVKENATATISALGESGYIRFLGQQKGAEVLPLEPDPVEEFQHLKQHFSSEQIKLFYILREAQRVRERKGYSKTDIEKYISKMMVQVNVIFPEEKDVIPDIAALDKAFIKYWGNDMEWWQAPVKWFTPGGISAETGGIFTNDINKMSSEFRDYTMYKRISAELKKGKKVMAVVGKNHVPMQAAAIECSYNTK